MWLLKPTGANRGQGIEIVSSLSEAAAALSSITGDSRNWIAQSYVPNPMLVKSRKFDIRIWTLWVGTDLSMLCPLIGITEARVARLNAR